MEITDEQEIYLVLQHRKKLKEQMEIFEKQKNCKHNYEYSGWGHKGDVYTCTLCGRVTSD